MWICKGLGIRMHRILGRFPEVFHMEWIEQGQKVLTILVQSSAHMNDCVVLLGSAAK